MRRRELEPPGWLAIWRGSLCGWLRAAAMPYPPMRATGPEIEPVAEPSLARDRARVGPDRLHRLRRAARAHRAVSRAVRAAPRAGSTERAVRARDRRHQPAARPGLDAARDLLRVAAARGPRARCSAASASSCPGWSRSSRCRRCSCRGRRPPGCAAPAWAPARRSPRWRCAPGSGVAARSGTRDRRGADARSPTGSRGLAAALAGTWLVLVLLACGAPSWLGAARARLRARGRLAGARGAAHGCGCRPLVRLAARWPPPPSPAARRRSRGRR